MKKLITAFILTFVFYNSGHSARIISIFEIARWYLDADLVLICNVSHTDTLFISEYDSLQADGFHLRYDVLREKYHISVDSVLKAEQNPDERTDTIFTPEFISFYRREKREFAGLNSDGDSIFNYIMEINSTYDDSWFRIKSPEERLVILRKNETGYVIDYQQKWDSSLLNLIQEVNLQGEDFFSNWLSFPAINSENIRIYPNPFTDFISIKGIRAKRIEITAMNGKTTKVETPDPHHIDLSGLKSGV